MPLTANREAGFVKVTIDLPEDLVRELKLKAVYERRKLKDVVAEKLRSKPDELGREQRPESKGLRKTLPVLKARRVGTGQVAGWTARRMSAWVKERGGDCIRSLGCGGSRRWSD